MKHAEVHFPDPLWVLGGSAGPCDIEGILRVSEKGRNKCASTALDLLSCADHIGQKEFVSEIGFPPLFVLPYGAQETGAQGPHPEQRNLQVEMNRRVRTAMVMVITVTCQVPRAGGLTSCQALC